MNMFRVFQWKWRQFQALKAKEILKARQVPKIGFWENFDNQMRAWQEEEVRLFGKNERPGFFRNIFKWYNKIPPKEIDNEFVKSQPQATVAFFITKKMEMQLKELGYKQSVINKLTPSEANFILENKIQFNNVKAKVHDTSSFPDTIILGNDIEPEKVIIMGSGDIDKTTNLDKSFQTEKDDSTLEGTQMDKDKDNNTLTIKDNPILESTQNPTLEYTKDNTIVKPVNKTS